MMLIFPFEEKIYKEYGIPAAYIGHPLKEKVKISFTREEFFKKYELNPQKKLIALLPGSRKSELKYHMPSLLESLHLIQSEWDVQFILLLAETLESNFLLNFIPPLFKDLKILSRDHNEAMASSDLILSSCGTANLEAALLETPFIAFYRISPLTYFFGRRLAKIKNFSIVNILAGKRVVPELIQQDYTAERIFEETIKILTSEKLRVEMKSKLLEQLRSQNKTKCFYLVS